MPNATLSPFATAPMLKCMLIWIATAVLVGACNTSAAPSETPAPIQAPAPDPAPAFTLTSLDGESVSLEGLGGRAVVIHFGTSWCPFCRAEDPHLEALYQTYKERGVEVLVINVGETDSTAARWKREAGFSFPMLLDRDGEVSARYAPADANPDLPRHEVMIASNLVIDGDGRIRFLSLLDSRAFDAQLVALRARLDEVLAES